MKLKLIQERVVAALKATAYFDGKAEILAEDKGDPAAELKAAMLKTRCGILVQTPGFAVTSTASKVMVGTASIAVEAIEKVLENRSRHGLTAQDMAEVAAWTLNMLPVPGVGVLACRSIESALTGDNLLSYTVILDVQTTLSNPLDERKEEAV